MTLGEAIVRGILPALRYVTTVFRYQNQLAELERRVERSRGFGAKDANKRYLEALRRALEQEDGLDTVFARHWFSGVNPDIYIYTVYSADPDTSKEFAAFKADDSGALKFLYCSGVVLFRPTVSPIIYKQQIGRALTAGDVAVPADTGRGEQCGEPADAGGDDHRRPADVLRRRGRANRDGAVSGNRAGAGLPQAL